MSTRRFTPERSPGERRNGPPLAFSCRWTKTKCIWEPSGYSSPSEMGGGGLWLRAMLQGQLISSQVRRLVESYDKRLSCISHRLEMVSGDDGSLKFFVDRLEAFERAKDEIWRNQKKLYERMTTCEDSVQVSSSELRALIASQYETCARRLHVESFERHTKFAEVLGMSGSRSHDGVPEHHKKKHEDLHAAFTKNTQSCSSPSNTPSQVWSTCLTRLQLRLCLCPDRCIPGCTPKKRKILCKRRPQRRL